VALFSERFSDFLHNLRPHAGKAGRIRYPQSLREDDTRIAGGESCREMLVRCVKNATGGDERPFAVEDDLAVVAIIEWERKTVLKSASIQAIKADGGDIASALTDGANVAMRYFRLDAGQEAGAMFTHPYPHIHYCETEGPRYSLNGWQSDNAVIDFFEHVYLQCYHETWLDWAKMVWIRYCSKTRRRDAEVRFNTLVTAFYDSQFTVIEQLSDDIAALKDALRDAKAGYPLRVDRRLTRLLAYPIGPKK